MWKIEREDICARDPSISHEGSRVAKSELAISGPEDVKPKHVAQSLNENSTQYTSDYLFQSLSYAHETVSELII